MDDEFYKKRPLPRPPADSSRGMLRSKIECGMGTVPLSPKIHLQTWDGVMSGDRLLTMACSDKILRWNVVGMSPKCTDVQLNLKRHLQSSRSVWNLLNQINVCWMILFL